MKLLAAILTLVAAISVAVAQTFIGPNFTAPTAALGDSSNRIATTAFVQTAIGNSGGGGTGCSNGSYFTSLTNGAFTCDIPKWDTGVKTSSINFSVGNTDTAITIPTPATYNRYKITDIIISGASASLTTATVGVFTGAGATGTAIVTSGTAVTVNTAADSTNNNMQSLTINNQNTMSFNNATLFFRVQSTAAGTATVTIFLRSVS